MMHQPAKPFTPAVSSNFKPSWPSAPKNEEKQPDWKYDPELPLHSCFDWVTGPYFIAYRIEATDVTAPPQISQSSFQVISKKLSITSDINEDLSKEVTTISIGDQMRSVNTNERLLTECLELGFTHIYEIISTVYTDFIEPPNPYKLIYYVRGVKKPDWQTINGELQTVWL